MGIRPIRLYLDTVNVWTMRGDQASDSLFKIQVCLFISSHIEGDEQAFLID